MSGASSIGKKPSPTAPSPRQKKGRQRRKNQTRQGYKVDGGGKRPRCSSGSSTGLGIPARNDTDRIDVAARVGAPPSRPAAQKSPAVDLRSRRRLRSSAKAFEAAWHRVDLSAQGQPPQAANAGRAQTATV